MQINAAIVMVTFEYFMATPASSVLLQNFLEYIRTSLLGPESMQQFSLAIYLFSTEQNYGLIHVGPHSVSWTALGRSHNSEGKLRVKRDGSVTAHHHYHYYNQPAGILIAIFDDSSMIFLPEPPELSSFRKLIIFVPRFQNDWLSATKNSTHWVCKYSGSSRQLLFVTIGNAPLEDKSTRRKEFDVFNVYDVYCIREVLFVNRISTLEDMMAVERRRSNLKMAPLRCVAQPDPAFPVYTKFDMVEGTLKLTGGLMVKEAEFFSNEMNFSIESIAGTGWTEQLPNGSLVGMGSQLLSGEADVMISTNEFRPYRAEKLALGVVIYQTRVHAYFKRSTTALENLYLMPFRPSSWLVATIFFGVLTMTYVMSVAVLKKSSVSNAEEGNWDFAWLISMICQQGWHQVPQQTSLRLTFFSGITMSMFLYILFSSSIVALFSVDFDVFKNILDLPKHGFKLYALGISEASADVLKVTAAEASGLGTYISDRTIDFAEARELIMSGKSAIISAENQMYQTSRTFHDHSDQEYCSWVSDVYVPGAAATGGMLFRREDVIRDIFRFKMSAWLERGFRFRNQNSFERQAHSHCLKPSTQVKHLTLSHVKLGFQVYVFGFILAIFLFLWEYIMDGVRKEMKGQEKNMKYNAK